VTARKRHPTTSLREVHEALVTLSRCHWLQTPDAIRAVEELDEQWLIWVEGLMTPDQLRQWEVCCADFSFGKPTAADVRAHALGVLEGPQLVLRDVPK
jgi:hypothetical protein